MISLSTSVKITLTLSRQIKKKFTQGSKRAIYDMRIGLLVGSTYSCFILKTIHPSTGYFYVISNVCVFGIRELKNIKIILAFSGWDDAVLYFSQEDQLINSYVLTLMHCLLLQDTHEDLTFVKSPHIFLKYFPLPGPVKKRQVNKTEK